MDIIAKVTEEVKAHGACKSFVGGSLETLISELFSPQGIEFIMRKGYPGLDEFREIQKMQDLSPFGIYVDSGNIELSEHRKVFLVGNTRAMLQYRDLARNKVCLIHGAIANIKASGYCVLRIEKDKDSSFKCSATEHAKVLQ